MATINYIVEVNPAAVKVEWSGLSASDQGQVFNCAGMRIASVQAKGNFNGGHTTLQVSNEVSPSTFFTVQDFDAPVVADPAAYAFVGAIKPVADASITSVGIAILFVRD
jgi:hypothetical protein